MISIDTHELTALSVDLGKIGFRATGAMIRVFDEAGEHLVQTWAANARQTSGEHGKHYPDSIDMERRGGTDIVVEVGPNPAKPQGGMSFEYGSRNQPAHLDGQRATDTELPLLDHSIQRMLTTLGL